MMVARTSRISAAAGMSAPPEDRSRRPAPDHVPAAAIAALVPPAARSTVMQRPNTMPSKQRRNPSEAERIN